MKERRKVHTWLDCSMHEGGGRFLVPVLGNVLKVLYRVTFRKSLLPFCCWLNTVAKGNARSFHISEVWTEIILVLMRWPPHVYFSLPKMCWCAEAWPSQSIALPSKGEVVFRGSLSRKPDKNEPAVQTRVRGLGPDSDGSFHVQGKCKTNELNWI